jgi:hypothetical protein
MKSAKNSSRPSYIGEGLLGLLHHFFYLPDCNEDACSFPRLKGIGISNGPSFCSSTRSKKI